MLYSLIAVALLAALHLGAGRFGFFRAVPRSGWLSFAGGVGVAYVFVHLLPELAHAQTLIEENRSLLRGFLERHVYLMALSGFTAFYGIERLVKIHRQQNPANAAGAGAVFWLHMASFVLYNGLIGYMLAGRKETASELGWFTLAMALHFTVIDQALRHDHQHLYHSYGRWLLAVGLFMGWAISALFALPSYVFAALLAFLAGAIVLNVIKEEIPRERQSRILPFIGGAALCATILLAA